MALKGFKRELKTSKAAIKEIQEVFLGGETEFKYDL
jgi:hypothetical protein